MSVGQPVGGGQQSGGGQLHAPLGPQVHIDFVEMLFALAAAEVAVKAGEFVDAADLMNKLEWNYLAVVSHLLLATVIIAASWVGWRFSSFAAANSQLKTVFDFHFVELIFDVMIVVFYFVLAHTVE